MNLSNSHFNFTDEELNICLKIAGIVVIGILTLFLLVKTVNEVKMYSTIGDPQSQVQNVISVSGKSDMEVKPDVTTFSWSVEAEGKTIEEAQSKSATINNKAIAFVKEKGIKDADIKSISLDTYPTYETTYTKCVVPSGGIVEYRENTSAVQTISAIAPTSGVSSSSIYPPCSNTKSVISGYITNQSVQVKVRDIDKNQKLVGELVAGLASVGVKVSTPQNSIDDINAYKKAVRAEAIFNARKEAEVLAKSLGVKLVRIVSFNENGGGGYMYAMDSVAPTRSFSEKTAVIPDLPTGTNNVASEVTITYQIK